MLVVKWRGAAAAGFYGAVYEEGVRLLVNKIVHCLAIPDTSRIVGETEIYDFKNKFIWAMWAVGDHFYKAFVDDVKGAILLDDLYLNNSLFKPRV